MLSKKVKAVLPLLPFEFRKFRDKADSRSRTDLIVTPEVFKLIKNDSESLLHKKDFNLFVADVSTLLTLFDNSLLLAFCDGKENVPRRYVISRNSDVIRWGEKLFSYYKSISTPFRRNSKN